MNTGLRSALFGVIAILLPMRLDGPHAQSSCTSPADCDDGNVCTQDICDPVSGCIHQAFPLSIPCNDGNPCTTYDRCHFEVCAGTPDPFACEDFNPCTVDSCDPVTGCVNVGPNCSDGDPCTTDICPSVPGGPCGHQPACDDGNPCTDDTCDPNSVQCFHSANGSCTANPKSLGYWERVCRGAGNSFELFTVLDVDCIRALSCTFDSSITDSIHICGRLNTLRYFHDACSNAEAELLALVLNVCRGRVGPSQPIDSRCAANTSVASALSEADGIMCDPNRTEVTCDLARCEAQEINKGKALHINGLMLTKLSGHSVRLTWTAPLADTPLSSTPRTFRVWRGTGTATNLVQIAEVVDTSFEDQGAEGSLLVYDVTPVW